MVFSSPDRGVVAGDDLLGRHVQHLLHHVELAADALDEGHDDVEAGGERAGVAAEILDRVIVALRDDLDRRQEDEHRDEQHDEDKDARSRQEIACEHEKPPLP